jgi:hypothetical protein
MWSAHTFVGGVSFPNFQFSSERNPRFVIESLDDNDGDLTRVNSQPYRVPGREGLSTTELDTPSSSIVFT